MVFEIMGMSANLTPINNATETRFMQSGYYPNAKPVGIIILLSCVATVVANTILIISYHRSPNLRTPFNVYIINLAFGDLLQAAGSGWAKMELYYSNGWQFGKTACTIHIYMDWISSIFLFHLHLLISINRLWAVSSPLTYKVYHNKKAASLLCIVVWMYAHAWVLPALIPDVLYYREDNALDCSINGVAQPGWYFWVSTLGYLPPMFLIVAIYPVICWKFRKYRDEYFSKNFKARIAPLQQSGMNTLPKSSASTRQGGHSAAGAEPQSQRKYAQNPTKVFHFKIISCLVMGVIVCWLPLCAFFVAAAADPDYNNFIHYSVASVLYFVNPLLNPVIYPLAAKEWRQAFRRALRVNC